MQINLKNVSFSDIVISKLIENIGSSAKEVSFENVINDPESTPIHCSVILNDNSNQTVKFFTVESVEKILDLSKKMNKPFYSIV